MSVGLLILGHNGIGPALLGTTTLMMGVCPLPVKLLTVSRDSNPVELLDQTRQLVTELDEGDGVLILADLSGSTPSNVAQQLLTNKNVRIVTGINLPMLIRVLNYHVLGLDELTEKAISGGKDGIMQARAE